MSVRDKIDPFFYRQPELCFIDEMKKPLHETPPDSFGKREAEAGEAFADGIYLDVDFCDENGALQTAYEDFNRFLKVYSLDGNGYPIRIKQKPTECFEAYHICVCEAETVVFANDTEGIRRALVYIEDEMCRREGAFLPLGELVRKPRIRTRITRGFFSPTNRPPKCINELEDDIDYYPDEYLNRLAHDSVNGIWIYTRFWELLEDNEYHHGDEKSKKRMEKLNKIIKKCARYGIKIYIFAIEPQGFTPEMAEKYPELVGGGVSFSNERSFCTNTEEGKNYCINSTKKIFERAKGLGGLITITAGERVSSCAAFPTTHSECPRCSRENRAYTLAKTAEYMKEGIRRAGSDAEFISWTYEHRFWSYEDIGKYVEAAPSDVALMQNFDDAGYPKQLGRTRQAIDYWLSYAGPSELFRYTGEKAVEHNKKLYAKMQVCCSHELASVPYIPVPGIVFDKYKGAFEYGVEGVLQCWYFGNYPSLMSKAAGELAFTWDFSDKEAFLKRLAGIYFGRSHADDAVRAWSCFEKGYVNYPVNIMFSYYGPMHDGVVWELALLPKNKPLPRSWLLLDRPDGDRIGECLWNGHTLDEAIELCERIKQGWQEGISALPDNTPREQKSVAEALGILFASGCNILRFYKLRELLGLQKGNADALLCEAEEIVKAEISNSEAMLSVCKKDGRIGYHSEAEGFKFFPEKLEYRIDSLRQLLDTELLYVRERVKRGLAPLEFYEGDKNGAYIMRRRESERAFLKNGSNFALSYDNDSIYINIRTKKNSQCLICFETRLMWPMAAIVLQNGRIDLGETAYSHQQYFGKRIAKELSKYKYTCEICGETAEWRIKILQKNVGWDGKSAFKLRIAVDGISWKNDAEPTVTLGKSDIPPTEFGWIIAE